ncbi:hypothetical protein [Meridianimaribacter flavus]|uniref:DUF3108 domain-containing protein n=1 Tax=Meridianimaribacter flavus TaxID=571115 RepID=A0ABY2G8R6_9FLAO|nr:hypothetical protein [Meridianimaribacter flavus]TDY13831.1 hypothetical protein A8975_0427 [Meridianimaribacter flavus]
MSKLILMLTMSFIINPYFTITSNRAQSNWTFTKYAEVTNKTGTFFTLEYGILSTGYNGRIKWRITNHTQMPVYDVGIANKTYTLSNGEIVSKPGETFSRMLGPGESKESLSDAVNPMENYTKNWVTKNDNPIVKIHLDSPMIKFAAEKNGERYSWEKAGAVTLFKN